MTLGFLIFGCADSTARARSRPRRCRSLVVQLRLLDLTMPEMTTTGWLLHFRHQQLTARAHHSRVSPSVPRNDPSVQNCIRLLHKFCLDLYIRFLHFRSFCCCLGWLVADIPIFMYVVPSCIHPTRNQQDRQGESPTNQPALLSPLIFVAILFYYIVLVPSALILSFHCFTAPPSPCSDHFYRRTPPKKRCDRQQLGIEVLRRLAVRLME